MPLPKRVIEPVHVTRGTLPDDYPLPSELEGVTNGTLANTVRQLSSLSRHAEDLFGELARDAQQLYDRSNSLQARIDRLAIKVTQLDSTVEEVSLQDIHMRKAFKSSTVFDQHVSLDVKVKGLFKGIKMFEVVVVIWIPLKFLCAIVSY